MAVYGQVLVYNGRYRRRRITMDNNGQQRTTMDNNPLCYMHLWCRLITRRYTMYIIHCLLCPAWYCDTVWYGTTVWGNLSFVKSLLVAVWRVDIFSKGYPVYTRNTMYNTQDTLYLPGTPSIIRDTLYYNQYSPLNTRSCILVPVDAPYTLHTSIGPRVPVDSAGHPV